MRLFPTCYLLSAILALAISNSIVAQETAIEDLAALTVDVLVAEVERHNHHLLSAAAAVEAAQFRIAPASALDDPTLRYMLLPRSVGSDIGFRHGGEISQSFPWPGKRDLLGNVAEQRRDIAFQDQEMTRLDVVTAAKIAFAEWHYLHRAIEINAANSDVVRELLAVSQALYASGRAPQQDVLNAEVELVLLEQALLELHQETTAARSGMNLLLNRPIDAHVPPPAPFAEPGPLPQLASARAVADEIHPFLLRQEALIDESHAREALADKDFLPDFRAFLAYADILDERDKRLQIGVSINLPIGREKRRAELDAVRAEVRRNQHELEGHRQELLAQIETAYAQMRETLESMRLYEEQLMPLAQASLDLALSDYGSSSGQFINVISAQRQQLATEQGYERTRSNYWRRRAELERSVGVPDASRLEQRSAVAQAVDPNRLSGDDHE